MKRMLPALLKLLLVLAAVSHGTATFCDITETKTSVQCYGALGQSVFIYLFKTSFEIVELKVSFQGKEFFQYKDKPSGGTCQTRCQLIKNGTLRLDGVMKSDSGEYTFEGVYGDRTSWEKRNIFLTIQDPVSPPALSQLCLYHGEIWASCSSTGDDPQYSWTLDDRPLDGGVALLSDETQTVILRRNVSGSITCTASNRVSSKHTTQELLKCPGTATSCDITENKALFQCYGALGQSVSIYPFKTSVEIDDLRVFFQGKVFSRYKKKQKTSDGPCQNRCQLIENGTLRLDHALKNDSGIYTIDAFDDKGISKLKRNISLTIQDPVSPPALSQLCLSHGEIRASCNSTGEDPQYSWTLNDSPLDGGVAFLSDETQTVILSRSVSGSITCTASNRVSSEHTTQELLKCSGLGAPVNCTLGNGTKIEVRMNASLSALSLLDNTEIFFRSGGAEMVSAVCTSRPHTPNKNSDSQKTPPICGFQDLGLPVALGVCLLLMVLLLGTCCLYKKKQKQTKTSQGNEGDRCEDPQELVYCQVQVVKKTDRHRPKKQEQDPQVAYGEVKVSGKSKAVRHTPNEQADTIYSGIRT